MLFVNMISMRHHNIVICFKHITFYFSRPFLAGIVALVLLFFPCNNLSTSTRLMQSFGGCGTLTPTHCLVTCRHLLELGWKNVSYQSITGDNIDLFIFCLFKAILFWRNHHAVVDLPDQHIQ